MARIKKEMIKERLQASDLLNLKIAYACEDCVYFMTKDQACNLGHKTIPHRRANQLVLFSQSGHMKFCRFLEID